MLVPVVHFCHHHKVLQPKLQAHCHIFERVNTNKSVNKFEPEEVSVIANGQFAFTHGIRHTCSLLSLHSYLHSVFLILVSTLTYY